MSETPGFAFGSNWDDFVRTQFSEERLAASRKRLLDFLGCADLGGRSLLDVGCGSGLHSWAALRCGAGRIVSFDVDPLSVQAARRLHAQAGEPASWRIFEGSILDPEFTQRLEPADVVYAWGSLHHTGAMWQAIENTARLVAPGGLLYLALYTTTRRSAYWLEAKKRYSRAGRLRRRLMEGGYLLRHTLLPELLALRSPLAALRASARGRGMSYMTDLRDWLGGYPYEDASIEEVLRCGRRLGFELVNLQTGEANTEYLFARKSAR